MSNKKSRNSLKLIAWECGEEVRKVMNSESVEGASVMPETEAFSAFQL